MGSIISMDLHSYCCSYFIGRNYPSTSQSQSIRKFAGILNLVTVGLLVVAGIFLFMAKGTFVNAQDSITKAILENGYAVGAGFIIAGILAIAGGVVAILPAAIDLSKKK